MDEYISRQEMLDAVDHLHIIPSIDGTGKPTPTEDFRVQFLGTVLKVKPAADVVPVVRCRDCREFVKTLHWCESFDNPTGEDDFCSYGEKKE